MSLEIVQGEIAREGESIYYELVRSDPDDQRPVVVLTHGAGGTHAVWYQQVPALGERFRVLTWDSRGFGNSTNVSGEPTADAAAGDLAAILDELGIERAHLIGQSMGGWHITAFATDHGPRVRSLVYADTIGGLWTEELRDVMAAFRAAGGLGGRAAVGVGDHVALWPGTAERDRAHAFLYQALGSFHSPPLEAVGRVLSASGADHDDIAALGVRVLFVVGTHDQIFPVEPLRRSAALIEGAAFVEIPASGHSPYFEQPNAWNDAVISFLGAIPT